MIILDASALLAYMFRERGHKKVFSYLPDCCISSVNLAEVVSRFTRDELPAAPVLQTVLELGIHIESYSDAHILSVANLAPIAKKFGLSLADRVCLGLGLDTGLSVVTADKVWQEIGLDIDIFVIR